MNIISYLLLLKLSIKNTKSEYHTNVLWKLLPLQRALYEVGSRHYPSPRFTRITTEPMKVSAAVDSCFGLV